MSKPIDHISETFLWEINKAQLICENCETIKNIVIDQSKPKEVVVAEVESFRDGHYKCE